MKTMLTQEQSSRLIELGVDKKMASEELIENIYQQEYNEPRPKVFTLTDLLSILPKKITDRKYIYALSIQTWDSERDGWCMKYEKTSDYGSLEDSYLEAEELIDAIYEMLVFLKEHKELIWL